MKEDRRKAATALLNKLVHADEKSELKFHTTSGPNGVEITIQVPRKAVGLADPVKRLSSLIVEDAV